MMGLNDIIHKEDRQLQPPAPRHAKVVEIDRPDPTWNVGRVALVVNNSALPRLVMFRDSFGSALVPFLAEHSRRSVFLWQYDFDPQVIEKEKPD
jgi:alginate O-acetyltransferase complex protein AlgJ